MKKKNLILLSILFILSNSTVFSYVYLGGLEVESNRVLSKDQFIWISGFSYLNDIKYLNTKFKVVRIPMTVKYGLTNKIEFQGDIVFNSQSSDFNESPRGLEKISFSTRTRLNSVITTKLSVSMLGDNDLYYGVDDAAAGIEVQTGFKLLNGNFFGNVGYTFRSGKFNYSDADPTIPDIAKEFKNYFSYGLAYNWPFKSDFSLCLEYLYKGKFIDDGEDNSSFNIGAKYELDEDIELVGAVSTGLTDGAPNVGITIMFNKYFGYSYYEPIENQPQTQRPVRKKRPVIEEEYASTPAPATTGATEKSVESVEPQSQTAVAKSKAKVSDEERLNRIKEKMKALEQNKKPEEQPIAIVKPKIPKKEAAPQQKKITLLYCPNCGEQVPTDANFCPFCGFNLQQYKNKTEISDGKESIKKEAKPLNENVLSTTDESKFDNLMEKGKIAFHNNNYNEAINYFKKALTINPINLKALFNTAVSYYHAEEYQKAKEYFEKASSLNEKDVDSLNYLAWIYHTIDGNIQKAVDTYEKVLKIDADNQVARGNLERLGIFK